MDRVVDLSKTKVEFQFFPSEQLGKLSDMVNLLQTGVADMALMSPTALTGDFPLHSFFALPGLFENSVDTTQFMVKMYKEGQLIEEFTKKGFRPFICFALPNYEVFTTNKPIVKLEDFKGQKIRASGAVMGNVLRALGAAPVLIPAPDLLTGLMRGTVDGTTFAYLSARSYRIEEEVKYATLGGRLSSSAMAYAILEKTFQTLPDDVQKAMIQADKEVVEAILNYQEKETLTIISDFEKKGVKINRLSKDEQARWAKELSPLFDEWAKDMEKKGLPGKQLVNAYKKVSGR
jgi:TRAP-type C4-dicarboxylate transport system substrate-binding protein